MATVMVVEKEPNLRLLLELELADARHQSIPVADQIEVEDAMQFEQPEAVILGMGPHEGDEFRTLYWIKCHFPDLPVLLYATRTDVLRGPISRMADALLIKRSDPEPLMQALERLVRRKSGLSIVF